MGINIRFRLDDRWFQLPEFSAGVTDLGSDLTLIQTDKNIFGFFRYNRDQVIK